MMLRRYHKKAEPKEVNADEQKRSSKTRRSKGQTSQKKQEEK